VIFKKLPVGELTSPRLDLPRVGLLANCPVDEHFTVILVVLGSMHITVFISM